MTPARLLLGALAFLCVWTLGGHAVALGRLPFLLMHPVLALAVAAGAFVWRQRALAESIFMGFPPLADDWPRFSPPPWRSTKVRIASATITIAALTAVALQYKYSFFLPFWLISINLGLVALVVGPKASAYPTVPSCTVSAKRAALPRGGAGRLLQSLLAWHFSIL